MTNSLVFGEKFVNNHFVTINLRFVQLLNLYYFAPQ